MRRWHAERWRAAQRLRDAVRLLPSVEIPAGIGQYRKRKVLGCGHARCPFCHWNKVFRRKTRAELRIVLAFREQVAEFFGSGGPGHTP